MDLTEYEIFSYVAPLSSIEKQEKYDVEYMKRYLDLVYKSIEKTMHWCN